MSRRVYLLGVGLALVALALAVTDWALSLQPGVTEANVRRIRVGMTYPEVEAILGGPHCHRRTLGGCFSPCVLYWEGAKVDVQLTVSGGIVLAGRWVSLGGRPEPIIEASPGPFARLRAWLGW